MNRQQAIAIGRDEYVIPVGFDVYVNCSQFEDIANHSCEPNMGFTSNTTLVALSDLAADTELTFDYSTTTAEGWTMDCDCGAARCRKVIEDFAALPATVQAQLSSIAPPWILKTVSA